MDNRIKLINRFTLGLCCFALFACGGNKKTPDMKVYEKGTFGYDVNYLAEKDEIIVLKSDDGKAQVLVSPGYQGKVFTSTVDGPEGKSLGYLKYEALDSEVINEHMNGYGGENRLWLGPEGGKFSIYFKPGMEQVYDNWHTPAAFDTEAWDVLSFSDKKVEMRKNMKLTNYIGTRFDVEVNREVEIIEPAQISSLLGVPVNELKAVGYLTVNSLTNLDSFEWTALTGSVCIWMLDMYHPTPDALTIIPFYEGDEKVLGKVATTNYFGEIPANRLRIEDGVLYLKTDGKNRNKLGMNSLRTKAVAGNYDPGSGSLTVTTYDVDRKGTYLNQEWDPAKDPLVGDAMNAYNDGPLEDGSIMGPFLELESASPAAFLKPGEKLVHRHNVFHFTGKEKELTVVTEKLFEISIAKIKSVFN